MLVSIEIHAVEKKCPVCGQAFSDDIEACPNDGTNLELLGKPIESDDKKDEETEDDSQRPGDVKETPKAPKYKRLDQNKSWKNTTKPKSERSQHSDRRSRIAGDRRPKTSELEQRRQEEERRLFLEEDKRLLLEYERRRKRSWDDQKRLHIVEIRASKDRVAAEKRLLNSLGAPLASIGYRLFWMKEENDAGLVNAAEIDIHLARYRLRAGFSTLIGARTLSGRGELMFLEHITIGVQWPWRFSPYIAARGGVGMLVSERFDDKLIYMLTSIGADVGIDSWITPWIAITPSFGYERCMLHNAYWNSFTFKVSVGF
ncbi:MAG: hypothetical protein GY847_15520 [Proteobacteria bacterium]|nr:hypothetical protein [Pseudomonadota bacterium]